MQTKNTKFEFYEPLPKQATRMKTTELCKEIPISYKLQLQLELVINEALHALVPLDNSRILFLKI